MKSIIRITAAAAALAATLAQAAFPSWYPKGGFAYWGKIDEFRSKDAALIVNDSYYRVANNLTVHSLSQQSDSIARLHKGVTVGFSVGVTTDGQRMIKEVWLLPDTYVQPEGIVPIHR